MSLFFIVWLFSSWLNIGALSMIMPVVWFYAFFDCINIRFQDDQDFYSMEDGYLFSAGDLMNFTLGNKNMKLIAGVMLIAVGLCALWQNVALKIFRMLGYDEVLRMLREVGGIVPKVIVALIIIWIGVGLIRGNQNQRESAAGCKGHSEKEPDVKGIKDVEYERVDDHEGA